MNSIWIITPEDILGKFNIIIMCLLLFPVEYYKNITFPERLIVENIIPRNVIINRGAAEVDNHISRDDIFDYHPL